MANIAMLSRVLAVVIMVTSITALTLDQETTDEVISAAKAAARDDGELALVIQSPHGHIFKRHEIFHAKGPEDAALSLFYSPKNNKVSLESLKDGHLKSVSWGLGPSRHGSIVLVVSQHKVTLHISCKPLHSHTNPGRQNLLAFLSNDNLKLYNNENSPVEVYRNEKTALESLDCDPEDSVKAPKFVSVDESDAEDVKDFVERNNRQKRYGDRQMQNDDYMNNYINGGNAEQATTQRGDIPSSGIETCDDEVIRQIQLLRRTIETLRNEIADQKHTIDNLRGQLQQCCHRVSPPPVERCSGSSCYPGY